MQNRPDLVLEGIGFQAFDSTAQIAGTVPVFRFFEMGSGTHLYTAKADERDTVLNTRPDLRFEGTAFSVHGSPAADDVPVWRFFDTSSGTHLYSSSPAEHAGIPANRSDLRDEGVAIYVPK